MQQKRKTKILPEIPTWVWFVYLIPVGLVVWYMVKIVDTRPYVEQIQKEILLSDAKNAKEQLRVIGRMGASRMLIVDDKYGNRKTYRYDGGNDLDFTGLISIDQHNAGYYIAPGTEEKLMTYFNGYTLDEVRNKFGDYTTCIIDSSFYSFTQIVPVMNSKRYESGVRLAVDEKGNVIKATLVDNDNTSSNLFLYLPFSEKILAFNMGRSHLNDYAHVIENIKSEDKSTGFLTTVFNFLWGLIKGILGIIIGIIFIVIVTAGCGFCLGSIFLPASIALSYKTNLSNNTINGIIIIFSLPLVYIATITASDAFHSFWLIILPVTLSAGLGATIFLMNYATEDRCSKCHSIGTIFQNRYSYDFLREETFWRKSNRRFKRSYNSKDFHIEEYEVTNELIKRRVYEDIGVYECKHCENKIPYKGIRNEDEVLQSSVSIETEETTRKKEEYVYMEDQNGHKIRCKQSNFDSSHLISDEESGVHFRRDVCGNWEKTDS